MSVVSAKELSREKSLTALIAAQRWTVMGMDEYIGKSVLYEKIAQLEEIARNRYLVTPSNSPCYSRYIAQLDERTYFKHIIADFPAADVEPVRHGQWIYNIESGEYLCSACGENALSFRKDTLYGLDLYETCLTDYCPNCGARMNDEVNT